MSNNFGYKSDEPCVVCGKYNNNQSEPRFGYTVCEEHQNLPPSEIQEYEIRSWDEEIPYIEPNDTQLLEYILRFLGMNRVDLTSAYEQYTQELGIEIDGEY